jgi:hypothetical protein
MAGGEKSAGARTSEQGAAGDLSDARPQPCSAAFAHSGNATAGAGFILAGAPDSRRSVGAPWRFAAAPRLGWTWRLGDAGRDYLPSSFRAPPAPFRDPAFARGAGFCCVRGQPVYRFGWHRDLWQRGPTLTPPGTRPAWWRGTCGRRQAIIAGCSSVSRATVAPRPAGGSWKTAEVETNRDSQISRIRLSDKTSRLHRVPLFRVWRELRQTAWPALLDFWGLPNLQRRRARGAAASCTRWT